MAIVTISFFNYLNYVFIMQFMILTTFLRVMFHTTTPYLCKLHILKDLFVDFAAEIGQRRIGAFDHHRFTVVRHFASWFGVDPQEIQSVPNHVFQSVQIPFHSRRDRTHIFAAA